MRIVVLLLSFVLTATPALAETITPAEAPHHVGQQVTVEGAVTKVTHAASGKVIFIDMGGRYPNSPFTGVIFADDASKFPKVDDLEGKTIDITGTIKAYRGKAEIILNDAAQIKIK